MKPEAKQSNYDAMKIKMRAEFLKFDQDAMIRKFGLRGDAERLYIRFFNRDYAIDRLTGGVTSAAGEASYNEAMTIYDVLCASKPDCRASGAFINARQLSTIQGGTAGDGGGMFARTEQEFDGKTEALSAACERLGGVAEGKGDVAYRLPMFDFLPMRVQYWNSDEDFPASLQFFMDERILDFMHYETVWFAISHLAGRLKEEMASAQDS